MERPYVPPSEKDLKWNGWGYDDTGFVVNDDGDITLTGNKYWLSGCVSFYTVIRIAILQVKLSVFVLFLGIPEFQTFH